MDEILQAVADVLSESGRFDNVSYDGDGMILLAEDGVLISLHATELDDAGDDEGGRRDISRI